MKIILVITKWENSVLYVDKALAALGHEVSIIWRDAFTAGSSYLDKKLDEWGFKGKRNKYEENRRRELYSRLDSEQPDVVLWINSPGDVMRIDDFVRISGNAVHIAWLVDGVRGQEEARPYFSYMKRVGCFELQDVEYLQSTGISHAMYCPVGYNEAYENVKPAKKIRDIAFLGAPFRNRLRLLDKIAKLAEERQWKVDLYGPFWEERYFWKKWIFKYRYPRLYARVHNGIFSPQEAAEVYASSKICLNIHATKHKSPNPRTFEILACGSFELCDARYNYIEDLTPKKALDVFTDEEDLLRKLDYYLIHGEEREGIAAYGKEHNVYSIKNSLRQLLTGL